MGASLLVSEAGDRLPAHPLGAGGYIVARPGEGVDSVKFWERRLTQLERAHLRQYSGRSLRGFLLNRAAQVATREESGGVDPCFTCRRIARKIGREVAT